MSPIYTPGKLVLKKDSVATDPNTDPNIANVSLLLYGNGINGSTSIIDSSSSPKTVTVSGNAQISTAQSQFGGSSIALDGTGDYLTLPNTAAMALESSDFTIEAWIRVIAASSIIYSTGDTTTSDAFLFTVSANSGLQVFGGSDIISSTHLTTTISFNTWYHVALSRSGSTWKVFLAGVQQGSGIRTATYAANSSMYIGARNYAGSVGDFFNGYIDDLRITKGVARYTANFTPPTAPFPNY